MMQNTPQLEQQKTKKESNKQYEKLQKDNQLFQKNSQSHYKEQKNNYPFPKENRESYLPKKKQSEPVSQNFVSVLGVRFKKAGKIYYFDPDGQTPEKGMGVIVETARGVEFGQVEFTERLVSENDIVKPLKKIIRIATQEDQLQKQANNKREEEAFDICVEKAQKHGLGMKIIGVELTFDANKIIFYFTAEGRVDFRELVKELASIFRMRIELRQVGVRDESKLLNGIGICGRTLCCATFLDEFQPVSIKMAKEQNLSLNPTKISGICGRLMCCLKYEEETYEYLTRNLPNESDIVKTPDGTGEVLSVSALRQLVRVAVRKKPQDPPVINTYSISEIEMLHAKHVKETPQEDVEQLKQLLDD